ASGAPPRSATAVRARAVLLVRPRFPDAAAALTVRRSRGGAGGGTRDTGRARRGRDRALPEPARPDRARRRTAAAIPRRGCTLGGSDRGPLGCGAGVLVAAHPRGARARHPLPLARARRRRAQGGVRRPGADDHARRTPPARAPPPDSNARARWHRTAA